MSHFLQTGIPARAAELRQSTANLREPRALAGAAMLACIKEA